MFEYTEYELQKRRHKQELIRNEFETAGEILDFAGMQTEY